MKKPNIVMIMADDMGYWSMGCAGNNEIKTPNMDYLASCGMRFENFFCTSPVCSPARASILTGKMPSQHGVHDWISKGHINYNEVSKELRDVYDKQDISWEYEWSKCQLMGDEAIRYIDDFEAYTDILSRHGYTCGLSGKWHLGDAINPQKSFTYWETIAMGGDNYKYPVVLQNGKFEMLREHYITDYITDNAIDFLNQSSNNSDTPFYLSVHYTAPHSPWESHQHPKEFYDQYEDCEYTATPNVAPHEWAGKYTQEQRKKNLQGYYAATSAMDSGIGRIIETLKEKNMWEDTIIIFTSDNGMSMGHHGIFGKGNGTFPMNMYDTAVKVPMIITYPKMIKGNTVVKGLYSHYDIMPTIADMMEEPLQDANSYPGRSFKQIFNGEIPDSNEEIIILDEYGPVRMIRTNEYKYIHRYPYGKNELYNLVEDEEENNNLADNEDMQDIISDLKYRLEKWFVKYTDPDKDGTKQAVKGIGQLTLCGEKGKGKKAFLG